MAHRVSKLAERDLKIIAYYIATESGSVASADRQIDAITERFELLGDHPEIGRDRGDLGRGRRTFPVDTYVILYRVRGKDVLISCIAGHCELPFRPTIPYGAPGQEQPRPRQA